MALTPLAFTSGNSREALQALLKEPSGIDRAFTELQSQITSNTIIIAEWMKTQFSNVRSCHVRSVAEFEYILRGIVDGLCANLQFYLVPEIYQCPDYKHRDLFL